jgi:hypothetical protein
MLALGAVSPAAEMLLALTLPVKITTPGVGMWGDSGQTFGEVGVLGTADEGFAGVFINGSSLGYQALLVQSNSANEIPFIGINASTGGKWFIDSSGNLVCSGPKNAAVPIDGGKRTVALSAIESPVNWFEDFGSAQLVNGVALVTLDPDFMQTVNTALDNKVFPVPNGDCKGLCDQQDDRVI